MWSSCLRRNCLPVHRPLRLARTYNGPSYDTPPRKTYTQPLLQPQGQTTYFPVPPPQSQRPRYARNVFGAFLLGSVCFGLGVYGCSQVYDRYLLQFGSGLGPHMPLVEGEAIDMVATLKKAHQIEQALNVPALDLGRANAILETCSSLIAMPTTVSHACQLPSNLPCEDTEVAVSWSFFNDEKRDWLMWGVYDGHAGPRLAHALKSSLVVALGGVLALEGCLIRAYEPNDKHIIDTIKNCFVGFDNTLLEQAKILLEADQNSQAASVATTALTQSGSCALVSLYDPANRVLRVANTGDSRAVVGRWSEERGAYVAYPMSVDQTGFNPDEVARLKREHPGEEPVDPKTGRVHGIAVTRAFGDARWKWPQEATRRAHELFWGPAPRPDHLIRTPPYLTAEPEVRELRVQTTGAHPDFLIMATDGLWDHMSSDDAVTCVQLWLEKNQPTQALGVHQEAGKSLGFIDPTDPTQASSPTRTPQDSLPKRSNGPEDGDTYVDEKDGSLKWRVSPKHFVNEDANCGVHMVKNALGGNRRDLFCGIMTVQPPLSRNVRDDITVKVIFFGQETGGHTLVRIDNVQL